MNVFSSAIQFVRVRPFLFSLAGVFLLMAATIGLVSVIASKEQIVKAPAPQVLNVINIPTETVPPIEASLLLKAAEDYQLKGRLPEAVSSYEKAILAAPDTGEAYSALATLYFKMGLPTKSLETYQAAIDRKIDVPGAYFKMGYVAEQKKDFKAALDYYLKAQENMSGNPALTFNIGNVYAQLGDNDQALVYYKRAVAQNPNQMDAFINLSTISYYQGNYSDAQFYLGKAVYLGYQPPAEYVEELKERLKS